MSKLIVKNILQHPDKDEILSKLILDVPTKDINEYLQVKYGDVNDKKFVISKNSLDTFKDEYLDIYKHLRDDIHKVKEAKIDDVELSLKNNKTYKKRISELLDQEIDIKTTIKKLIVAIESRAEQVFDSIQQKPEVIGKGDYVLIQYFNTLTAAVEKLNKILNDAPDQIIQHNITLQVIDQHIAVFQDLIKDILAELDPEISLKFVDLLTTKLKNLKPPTENTPATIDSRFSDVKILSEKILTKEPEYKL